MGVASREFRSRVGITNITRVVPDLHQSQRKQLIKHLLDDTVTGGEFRLSLPSSQPASLDEAVAIVNQIVELSLNVYSAVGLEVDVQQALCDWMLTRTVRLPKGESKTLPFTKLDAWVQAHEALLLPVLRERYVDQLVGELENRRIKEFTGRYDSQCESVLAELQVSGEDDRPAFWNHLSRLSGVYLPEAVEFSWKWAITHCGSADQKAIGKYIVAHAKRLRLDMTDPDDWAIESWHEGADKLLQICNSRMDSLDDSVCSEISQLAFEYALEENCSEYSTQLLDILITSGSEHTNSVVAHMIERLFVDLPRIGVVWLAKHFQPQWSNEEAIRARLQEVYGGKAEISESESRDYADFLGAVTMEGWSSAHFVKHIVTMFRHITEKPGFDVYLKPLFPTLLISLSKVKEERIGTQVTALFQKYQSQPKELAWLHCQSMHHWPTGYPGLGARQIANLSISTLNSQPGIQHGSDVLKSLWKLLILGEIPREEFEQRMVDLAVEVWPYDQSSASEVLVSSSEVPPYTSISGLGSSVDWGAESPLKALGPVWRHFAEILDDEGYCEVARQILDFGPLGTQEFPDALFGAWIEALGPSRRSEVVESLLVARGLPDEHVDRIWASIVRDSKNLDVERVVRVLPALFGNSALVKTHKEILESSEGVNDVFKSAAARSALAQGLLKSVTRAGSLESKRGIVDWMVRIDATVTVIELRELESELDEATLDLLATSFPASRKELAKLKKKLFTAKTAQG